MLLHILIKVNIEDYFYRNCTRIIRNSNEAIIMYDSALKINPYEADAYYNKGKDLFLLFRKWSK